MQEVCSTNGTCISCVLATGPSASSLNTFKNNSLLQSFPPHSICSKCSPLFGISHSLHVANDRSRALLTPYKGVFNCFGFVFPYLVLPVNSFLSPSLLSKCFDFHVLPSLGELMAAVNLALLSLAGAEVFRALPTTLGNFTAFRLPLRWGCIKMHSPSGNRAFQANPCNSWAGTLRYSTA